ncbi:MAG: hypothetical protein N3G20_00990 [Verrucomicrobiae bacterium]|nr:hypothetical protein [Verrucomicrobiae bacterium]
MSTSKVDHSGAFQPVTVRNHETELRLAPHQVLIRKNGVAFMSANPIPLWRELTLELQMPAGGGKVKGTGVVVDCTGNKHYGYVVSLVFMSLSRDSEENLSRIIGATAR